MADDVIAFRSPFCVGGIHRVPSYTSLQYLTALQCGGFELDRVPSDASPQLLVMLERAGFQLDVPHVDAEPDTVAVDMVDEIHVHQNRDVWNALSAAPVKRGPGRPRKT